MAVGSAVILPSARARSRLRTRRPWRSAGASRRMACGCRRVRAARPLGHEV